VLFAFDKKRKAILLVGGDKSTDWTGWYKRSITIADDRFDEHQAVLAGEEPAGPQRANRNSSSSKGKGRR
jgi:hypothetical protein